MMPIIVTTDRTYNEYIFTLPFSVTHTHISTDNITYGMQQAQ